MLFLVGTGISFDDLSISALEKCKECTLYIERYTTLVTDEKVRYLSKITGKEIQEVRRADLEENAKKIVESAKRGNIAILVGGDPLTATTHKILFLEARRKGVQVRVLHSSSAISATIGSSGLDFYRFGQVCTIPRWSSNYKPVSFYEVIERNSRDNLHSLILLDYYPERESTLEIGTAIEELEAAEMHYKRGIIRDDTQIFVMQNIALDNEKITITTIGEVGEIEGGMASIILPAKLSEIEEEVTGAMKG